MQVTFFVMGLAIILLAGLLVFEKKADRRGLLPFKAALSLLFVLIAVWQPRASPAYALPMLTGLILCLMGDVFLALPGRCVFLLGLISFLCGHMAYLWAFLRLAPFTYWAVLGLWFGSMISTVIYRWLKPYLGAMRPAVMIYVMVITLMLCGAWALIAQPSLSLAGKRLIFLGALMFYVSDAFVARDRFVATQFINRLIGLPLYYAGQFLLAFSLGFVH
jgi:uncharacterized membrane protein YhhN